MTSLTTGEKALLRSQPILPLQGQYLSVAPRTPVFQAQVNGAPFQDTTTLGYYAAAYDNVTLGAYTDVVEDMSVDFGTTPGARDIGTARVRFRAADAFFVYFTETAPASLLIVDNCYITVVEEYRPWMVLPRGVGSKNGVPYTNDITLYMDYDSDYVGAGSPTIFFPPKVNITRSGSSYLAPKPAAFVDGFHTPSEQVYRTMVLSGWLSFSLATGAIGATYSWDVADGTITAGTAASATITVQFPVGFRYIALAVTIDGETSVMHYPVWCHDDTYLPLTHFKYNRNSTSEWREMELDFFQQDTSATIIPRGTALCYWKIPYFSPVPDAYRDQMLGWAKEDTTLFRKYQARNTITLLGLGAWLDLFRCFPLRVYDPNPAAVDTWFEMYAITLDRLAFYILEFFTTSNRIANFFKSDITDELKSLDITGSSIWQMLKYIYTGSACGIRCDSLNGIWARRHYSYMTTTERSAVTPLIALTPADWRDESPPAILRREFDPVGQVIGTGSSFDYPTANLYKASAAGRTPGAGAESQDAPFQNLPFSGSQDTLNWLTGQHYAYLNNERQNVPFDLLYPLDCIEPAWGIPIQASTDDSDSGVELNNDLFLVKEVNLAYERPREREQVTWSTEGVTLGAAGQMEEVDINEYTPPDVTPPPEVEFPYDPPVIPRLPAWDGVDTVPTKLFVLDSGGAHAHVARSWNPLLSTLSYTDISTGLTGAGIWACPDPYDYRVRFALMTTGLYRCANIWAASPVWTLVASNATMFGDAARIGKNIEMSINRRGYIAVCTGTNTFVYSVDYGATWHVVSVNGAANNYGTAINDNTQIKFRISPFNSLADGRIYAMVYEFSFFMWRFYRSDDWGATWAATAAAAIAVGTNTPDLNIPYRKPGGADNSNDATQVLYVQGGGGNAGESNQGVIKESSDAAATWATQASYSGGSLDVPSGAYVGRAMQTFTYDGAIVFSVTTRTGAGADVVKVRYSDDEGVTPTVTGTLFNNAELYCGINGYSIHSEAWLTWSRLHTTLYWRTGATTGSAAAPIGYTGLAYCDWDLSDIVPAA